MKYLVVLASSLSLATPGLARNAEPAIVDTGDPGAVRLPAPTEITVVATGLSLPVSQSGQSISVIGAQELASVQGPDLTRVLERLPGVTISRNGGVGSFTGLRVRGADAEQLLVLVDGVRLNDIAAPAAGYDLGNLLSGGIGKIELLRGSNSVVWGSQAMGGVLAVTTRELNGVEASAEYGARDSADAEIVAGLSTDRYGITLTSGYTRTDGTSAADIGTEPDGYRQWRVGGRGRVALTDSLSLIANARYARGRLDIDGYPAPTYFIFDDTDDVQRTREISALGGVRYTSPDLSITADYVFADIRRGYSGESYAFFPYATRGRSERAELFGAWTIAEAFRLDFGGDTEWSHFSDSSTPRRKARLSSGHALLGYYGDRLNLAAGGRIDDHSQFGTEWTLGANGSYRIVGKLRLRASYGEGFKVPTLYQLFSDYGNTGLVPEKSRSYDAGLEYGDRNGPLHLALTGFRRDSRDLIDFVSCFSTSGPLCSNGRGGTRFGYYANVRRARAEGFELELGAQVSPHLRAQAAYSYVKATNRTAGSFNQGNDLARRPRHAVTVSADWTSPLHGLQLGGDIRMVGDSFDDAGNFTRLDGFALVTLRASLPLTEAFELYGRIENLTDERYETAAGYGTAGRSGFVGVRARF